MSYPSKSNFLKYINDNEDSIFENLAEHIRKQESELENQLKTPSSEDVIIDSEFDETTPKSSSLDYGDYCSSKWLSGEWPKTYVPDFSPELYKKWDLELMEQDDEVHGFEEDEKDKEFRPYSEKEANSLIASFDWIEAIIKDFHKLRKILQMHDGSLEFDPEFDHKLEHDPFGYEPVSNIAKTEFGLEMLKNDSKINFRYINFMDQIDIGYLIKLHINDFLKIKREDIDKITRKRVLMIYALLARVTKPLVFDLDWIIKKLYNKCGRMRREIEDVEKEKERLSYFNLLSAIAGIYFGMNKHLSNCIMID